MKTFSQKEFQQIDEAKLQKYFKEWGVIAYGNSNKLSTKNNVAINMNDIFKGGAPRRP